MTGICTPSTPLVPTDQVSQRLIVVTLNGTDLPPQNAIGGSVTFACTAGDIYSVVETDVNVVGNSLPSSATAGTVPTIPIVPTAVPTTPGPVLVSFTNP